MPKPRFDIKVVDSRAEVEALVEQKSARRDADCGGWIVQKYIENPLLIRGRKFDVRLFVLLVPSPPDARAKTAPPRAYVYRDAYVRTSGERFSLEAHRLKNRFVHLTNDG